MTSCLISVALVFTPAPLTAPKEAPQWPSPISASSVISASSPLLEAYVDAAPGTFTISSPMPLVEPPPPEPEPPSRLTPTELVDELFGWPGRQLVQCESRWDQYAVGRYGERGLLQIHPVHALPGEAIPRLGYTWAQMFEVEPNIRVAVEVRRVQGLRAWTCWRG